MNNYYWVLDDIKEERKKKSHVSWTENELKYLRDNFNSLSVKEIADKLVRPEASVRSKANQDGLYRRTKSYILPLLLSFNMLLTVTTVLIFLITLYM